MLIAHVTSKEEITAFKHEIKIMSGLRAKRIVNFYGACTHPDNMAIVMELMDSNLATVLQSGMIKPFYSIYNDIFQDQWNGEFD